MLFRHDISIQSNVIYFSLNKESEKKWLKRLLTSVSSTTDTREETKPGGAFSFSVAYLMQRRRTLFNTYLKQHKVYFNKEGICNLIVFQG